MAGSISGRKSLKNVYGRVVAASYTIDASSKWTLTLRSASCGHSNSYPVTTSWFSAFFAGVDGIAYSHCKHAGVM